MKRPQTVLNALDRAITKTSKHRHVTHAVFSNSHWQPLRIHHKIVIL